MEEPEKEKEKQFIDAYAELRSVLEQIRPTEKRLDAIVGMMEYSSLDNLEALNATLRLAGWRKDDIKWALKAWGLRRGLINEESEPKIEEIIKKDESKGIKETEGDEIEVDKTIGELYRDKLNRKRLKEKLEIIKDLTKEKEEKAYTYVLDGVPIQLAKNEYLAVKEWEASGKREESEKIPYVIDGRPVRLFPEEFLAMKRWEKEQETKEKELKKEPEEKAKEQTIMWTLRNGETKEVSMSALPYLLLSDVIINEKKEKNENPAVEIELSDGRKMKIREDIYPYIREAEREREQRGQEVQRLEDQIQEFRNEIKSYDPWAYVKAQTETMKAIGWSPSGKTEWDIVAQISSDIHDTVSSGLGTIIERMPVPVGEEEFKPEHKYSKEERTKRLEELGKRTEKTKKAMKLEDKILAL